MIEALIDEATRELSKLLRGHLVTEALLLETQRLGVGDFGGVSGLL